MEQKWVPRALIGISRSFDVFDLSDRLTLSTEFFYNGSGYADNVFDRDYLTRLYFMQSGLYKQNYYGVYYWGLYIIVRQIFIQDLSLSSFNIINVSDHSQIAALLWQYNPLHNFYLSLMLSGLFGPPNREYTWTGNGASVELAAKIVF